MPWTLAVNYGRKLLSGTKPLIAYYMISRLQDIRTQLLLQFMVCVNCVRHWTDGVGAGKREDKQAVLLCIEKSVWSGVSEEST